jgi:hypothetical protein
MGQPLILSIKANDTSREDAASLLSSIREVAEVEEAHKKGVMPGWQDYIIVIREVGDTVGGLAGFAALTKVLIDRHPEERGGGPQEQGFRARFRRPGKPPLDLDTADDEDIKDWMPNDDGDDPDIDKSDR